MSEFKLIEEIIILSVADTWDEAKIEWQLAEIYHQEEPDTCLCSHFPINEICVLRNKRNNLTTQVGNICVKKFLGLPSDLMFQALRRIAKDETRALNAETIDHAFRKGWINNWEKKFYFDTMRKRNLSNKQLAKRIQINRQVLNRTKRVKRND